MATMRELKGRINSVHSSQKITGAMKMISSARLRKAENQLIQARPYQQKLWEIYSHMRNSNQEYISPLAEVRMVKRVALVVFASDDGLCGAFNLAIYKKLSEVIEKYRREGVLNIHVIAIGKKIQSDIHKIKGISIIGHPEAFEIKDFVTATRQLVAILQKDFLSGYYDKVEVLYTYYKSMGVQFLRLRCFLPVTLDADVESVKLSSENMPWYILEPGAVQILETIYPLLLNAQMYEMYMSSRTSEQAARILAMQMANDNAIKLLSGLQLEYNKLRQQGITSELLDIAGGSSRD